MHAALSIKHSLRSVDVDVRLYVCLHLWGQI